MNKIEKAALKKQYQGIKAKNYDSIREITDRHKAEVLIIKEYIFQTKPKYILDCPCGTMRWIDIYADSNTHVLGLDISEDMIKQAKIKVAAKGLEDKISFLQSDIIGNDIAILNMNFDMVLCVRFLNWLPMKDVYKVITSLTKHSNSFLILSCTVIHQNKSLLDNIKTKYYLFINNIKNRKNKTAKHYIHKEKKLEMFLEFLGWEIVEKKSTKKFLCTENYLYLLKKR